MTSANGRQTMLSKVIGHITVSATRCHLLGAVLAIAMVIAIIAVGAHQQQTSASVLVDGVEIDLSDAATLVHNADRWSVLHAAHMADAADLQKQIDAVAQWLAPQLDWKEIESTVQTIAQSSGVTLASIERNDDVKGKRVIVATATCDLIGTFPDICRLLDKLAQHSPSIHCAGLTLRRSKVDPIGTTVEQDNEHKPPVTRQKTMQRPECHVSLKIRIPYAGEGTPAGVLFARNTNRPHDRMATNSGAN